MTEQEQFNEMNQDLELAPHQKLKDLLRKKEKTSLAEEFYNPIENAMKQHPNLTQEEAEEMAKAFGY